MKKNAAALEAWKFYQQTTQIIPLSHPSLQVLFGVKCSDEHRARVQGIFDAAFEKWLLLWLKNWSQKGKKLRDQNLEMRFFQSDLTITANTNSLSFTAAEQLIDLSVSLVLKYRRTS